MFLLLPHFFRRFAVSQHRRRCCHGACGSRSRQRDGAAFVRLALAEFRVEDLVLYSRPLPNRVVLLVFRRTLDSDRSLRKWHVWNPSYSLTQNLDERSLQTCRAVTFSQLKASLSLELVYNSMTAAPSVAPAKMMHSQRTLLLSDLEFKLLPFLNTEQRQPFFPVTLLFTYCDTLTFADSAELGESDTQTDLFLMNAADVQADTEAVRPFSSKLI